jgi:hypothetical protein
MYLNVGAFLNHLMGTETLFAMYYIRGLESETDGFGPH